MVDGSSSSQPARSGNLLILPGIAGCPHFASHTGELTVHGFKTALNVKALNMMVIPTEAVRSFSSFNWTALMPTESRYAVY